MSMVIDQITDFQIVRRYVFLVIEETAIPWDIIAAIIIYDKLANDASVSIKYDTKAAIIIYDKLANIGLVSSKKIDGDTYVTITEKDEHKSTNLLIGNAYLI